ncbi:MAG: bifunctional diguanylate cyclase/phosphodiesterase, partial [Pseudomonadota bacterium]|nr:bifunctional diguanylate cyclase/phosphodiesterase [Pseudomonadota bacterium]
LKQVAVRLGDCLHAAADQAAAVSPPLISRFAGDEFTAFLPQMTSRHAIKGICGQILAALCKPFRCDGRDISISASIGVTMFPDDGKDYETLLKRADLAMYTVKTAGRRRVHFYSSGLERRAFDRLTLECELRLALQDRQFDVFYQPIVSCAEGRIVGAEALVRWHHPVRGLLAPADFLANAEETGLLVDLGWYVLEQASRDAVKFAAAGDSLPISVNVSAVQFDRADFAERVLAILLATGMPLELLVLELTEATAMRDPKAAIARLLPLRKKGLRFAVDDFGVGYSSLSYLSRLPIDTLKIDKSFINTLQDGVDNEVMVTTIQRMAEGLRLETVAEGVETEAQFLFCRDCGVTAAQGLLFSAPLPQREFAKLLRNFRLRDRLSPSSVAAVA